MIRIRIKAVFTLLFVFPILLHAQDPKALEFGKTITQDDLYSYLSVLASDSLEGRETGTRGQKMAADFIRTHFDNFGLEGPVDGSFYQTFDLRQIKKGKSKVSIGGKSYSSGEEVLIYGKEVISEMTKMNLVFIGSDEEFDFESLEANTAVAFLYTGFQDMRGKVNEAKSHGIRVCFAIGSDTQEEFNQFVGLYRNYFEETQLAFEGKQDILTVFTHVELMADAFGKTPEEFKQLEPEGNEISTTVKVMSQPAMSTITTENVLGYLEGGDKKDELIVITAHYDHEGIINGEIYNGADDDASGTSAVMEIAQAFALAKEAGYTPRRSLLFMAVTGEEKGLLGSRYYSDNPVFPLENTVTNLNIDMIGRLDQKHKDNPNYVYLIGTKMLSDELHEVSEEVNEKYTQIDLDYRYNDKNDPNRFYYRSDHYNFAKNNIPVIFYFNGTHADYHQPSDTIEKIHFEKLEKISQLIFYTAWELANRDERVKLNN